MRSVTDKADTLALFAALCIFLSTVEYLIPKPIPFLRLGLANLPILLSLTFFSLPSVISLIVLKVLGQGLINGTLFSYIFLFSLSGSVASGLIMMVAYRLLKRWISLIGVSVLGALASNLVQLLVARYILLGEGAWIIGPPFLAIGLVSSFFIGLFGKLFSERSKWFDSVRIKWAQK